MLLPRRPPAPTLFPYTTLFRSLRREPDEVLVDQRDRPAPHAGGDAAEDPAAAPHHLAPVLAAARSEEHTSELQSQSKLVCRLLLEKKDTTPICLQRTGLPNDDN